ncbi:hypothetical protein BKA69DRAFT_3966 [Paraphysoderma sedebokerense]|nr:hypothetical protein BKA69DRAFT_3966 [Paraphysoderma sedebokerense]
MYIYFYFHVSSRNNRGEICEPCLTGAVCSTDGSIAPRAKLGWWRSDDNMTFLECFPKMACVGTAENTCAEGYEGIRCASCGKNFYRLGEACRECKVANYVPTIIAVSVIFAVVLLLTLLRHFGLYKLSFASMHILINFLQTIWILRNIRLDWPQELLELVEHINFIALNIDIVAPECIVQEPLTFSQRLRIVLALPICLLAITLLIASIAGCIKNLKAPRTNNRNRNSFLNTSSQPKERDNYTDIAFRVVGLFHVALSILYVNIAAKSFALFDCTVEDDGNAWLDAKVSLICYQDWWYQELPYGIAAIIVYALGIPLYFSVLSYFYYQTYHEGRFWDKWRQISGRLMERFGGRQFKPEYRYFVVLQLFEKLAMVAVSTFFTRYTGLQIVLTIIILLSLLITYMKYNPYEHPTLNILEKMSVVCSISVLAFGLPFKIDSFRSSQYRSALIATIMSLVAGFILAVLGAGLNDIRRNIKANREK